MQFRPQRRPDFALDMTPMIDCVFQLLIFFLLSSSFVTPAVQLELPRSDVEQPRDAERLVVSLDAQGAAYLNKEAVDKHELGARLRAALARDGKQPITVRADQRLEYRKVMEIVLAIRDAGGIQVRLSYEDAGK